MKKYIILSLITLFAVTAHASPPTRQNTYVSGTTIRSADVTENEDEIFGYLQAGVDTLATDAVDTITEIKSSLKSGDDATLITGTAASGMCGQFNSDGDLVSAGAACGSGSGGTGTPDGNNTEVQFNDSGSFGADTNFIFDSTNDRLVVTGVTVSTGVVIGTSTLVQKGVLDIKNEYIVVDSVQALRGAIGQLEAGDGGTIQILPGTYDLEGTGLTIAGTAPIHIIGSGTGNGNQGTRIVDDTANTTLITIGNTSSNTGNDTIKIENLLLYGDFASVPSGTIGLHIINRGRKTTIENVNVEYLDTGIKLTAEGNGNYCTNIDFDHIFTLGNNTHVHFETVDGGTNNYVNETNWSNFHFQADAVQKVLWFDRGTTTGEIAHHKFVNGYIDSDDNTTTFIDSDDSDFNLFTNIDIDGENDTDMMFLDANSNNWQFHNCTFDGDIDYDSSITDIEIVPYHYGQWIVKHGSSAAVFQWDSGAIQATGVVATTSLQATYSEDTELMFNDAGTIDGDTNLTWAKATDTLTVGGSGERITGTTYGEFIDFNDEGDDVIVLGGASGTDDTDIAFDLDGTEPRIYSPTDSSINISDHLIVSNTGVIVSNNILEIESIDFDALKMERVGAGKGTSFIMENGDNNQARIEYSGTESIDMENPSGSPRLSIAVTGMVVLTDGLLLDKVYSDPCTGSGYTEGTIFYNDTSNYWCGCDGTNDIKLSDGAACF